MIRTRSRIVIAVSVLALALLLVMGANSGDKAFHFSHGLHVAGAEMECIDCHQPGKDDMGFPNHDTCGMCHDVDDTDNCSMCHVDVDNLNPIEFTAWYPSFSHQTHVVGGYSCETCHGKITDIEQEVVRPTVDDCQTCHAVAQPLPVNHRVSDWAGNHGMEASISANECVVCHAQESCDECHQGTAVYGSGMSPHEPTWIYNHGIEATFGGSCLTCHEDNSYCVDCHRNMVPVPHEFGPSFANGTNGGTHMTDAEAFPETCIVCHDVGNDDPTCARCHTAIGG